MSYLFTFLPWIVYAALAGHGASGQQHGTLAALAVTVLVIAYKLRKGSTFDALIIETGSAVFFAAVAVVAFAAPHSGVLTYAAALSSTALAVLAWGSLAVGRPFTLGIAKQTTPREIWSQPAFIHSNHVITTIWAVSLTVSAAILTAVIHAGADVLVRIVFQILGFVVPMVFTARYVKLVHARAHAAAAYARPGAHARTLSHPAPMNGVAAVVHSRGIRHELGLRAVVRDSADVPGTKAAHGTRAARDDLTPTRGPSGILKGVPAGSYLALKESAGGQVACRTAGTRPRRPDSKGVWIQACVAGCVTVTQTPSARCSTTPRKRCITWRSG